MTLVIAHEESGRVIMGADSAFGNPEEYYVFSHAEKLARCGPYASQDSLDQIRGLGEIEEAGLISRRRATRLLLQSIRAWQGVH